MAIKHRVSRLERALMQERAIRPQEMTDEQLAMAAGFPRGYVPTDEELMEVAGYDNKEGGS